MTIATQTRTAGPFECNGSTTVFPFTFKVFTANDVSVVFRNTASGQEAKLVLNIDYTVSLNADQNANPGGSISTIGPAFTAGNTLTLTSELQYLQPTDLTNQGGFYPKVITDALDRLTIFAQQIRGLANRALKFPISDGNLDATIPGKDQRKGRVLAFHETTGLPVVGPTIADVGTVGGSISAIVTVANNIADVNTVADYADEVAQFNATYQGAKATDPTVRNDGSALQAGDLYFNTFNKALRTYTGAQWQEAITGSVAVQRFTGDGAATSFQLNSAPDNENVVQVFIGGVYQSKTGYDITGANKDLLTFTVAPPNGVEIEAVTFSVLPLGVVDANQVQMGGGTLLSDLAPVEEVNRKVEGYVSVFDFMSTAQRDAIKAGDTNQDITAAVQAALTSGAKEVHFDGINAICDTVTMSSVKALEIFGDRAKLRKPAGSGQNSLIFKFLGGCEDIDLRDFDDLDGGYYATNPTTGTRPVIIIGDESGNGDGGNTNKNIRIFRNKIRGANWAGIVVYGRSNNAVTLTPRNEDIRIFMNSISDCAGNGVFVYKNAHNVRVYGNEIYDMGYNCIVFDTGAESDSVTSEAITDIRVDGNRCYRYGKVGAGAGVQVKGLITDYKVSDNTIKDSQNTVGGFNNYGVLVTRDFFLSRPVAGVVHKNTVKDLDASGTAAGIVLIGTDNITVTDNTVKNTKSQNYQVSTATDLKFIGNQGENAGAGVYGFSFIGSAGNKITNLKSIGNTYKKGAGTSTGGFNYTYIDGLDAYGNDAIDFTTTAELISNCTLVDWLSQVTQVGAPTTGLNLQGMRQNETSPGTTNPVVQRVNISSGTPGVWRPVSWVVARNTTANRPTLTANDVGVMYLDNTLNANGRPIWWNGTAWVDSTGATV